VGRGGAAGALDRGWEAAEAAVDGKPGLRRGSGEVGCSGKGKGVEMQSRKSKSGFVGSSRTCSRSRRRHGRAGAAAGNRRDAWRLGRRWCDVEDRGEGQRGVGSGGTGAGTAHGTEGSGAGQQVLGTWPARAAGSGREKTERGGLEVDEEGPGCNLSKV
jgi:hypothetical protein